MKIYSGNSKAVVQFAKELLRVLDSDSLSITITRPEKSGGCFVSIATDTSLEDTVDRMAQSYSKLQPITSPLNTPAG